jgi:hypothetical protein
MFVGLYCNHIENKSDCLSYLQNESIYRVFVDPIHLHIEIVNFDVFPLETDVKDLYIDETDLPDWIKRKLSVLLFCDWKRKSVTEIDGVGRRIDEHTFWIYK